MDLSHEVQSLILMFQGDFLSHDFIQLFPGLHQILIIGVQVNDSISLDRKLSEIRYDVFRFTLYFFSVRLKVLVEIENVLRG